MSKRKRWQAAGRRWRTSSGQVVTSPFPGAKTAEDVGRQVLRNKRNPLRWLLLSLPPLQREQVRLVLARVRRRCRGREFYRNLLRPARTPKWQAIGQEIARTRRTVRSPPPAGWREAISNGRSIFYKCK